MNKAIRLTQFALLIAFVALFVGFFAQSGITQSINITPPGDKEIGGGVPIEEGGVLKAVPMTTRIVWEMREMPWFEESDIWGYDSAIGKIQLTQIKGWESKPGIWGNKIVWADKRNGNWDIYMIDTYTKQIKQVTTDLQPQHNPKIWGDKIVWFDYRSGPPWYPAEIYMYDLSTNQEKKISSGPIDQMFPDIAGNRIVWQDYRKDQSERYWWQIFMHDLSTGQETQITTGERNKVRPDIYGDWIVWQDCRNVPYSCEDTGINTPGDIYMYNIATGTEKQISFGGTSKQPAIYGNKVVWADVRNDPYLPDQSEGDIYMYNIANGNEYQITNIPDSTEDNPEIYGTKIVWMDQRSTIPFTDSWYNVFMYDLYTGQETKITDNPSWNFIREHVYPAVFSPLLFPIF